MNSFIAGEGFRVQLPSMTETPTISVLLLCAHHWLQVYMQDDR